MMNNDINNDLYVSSTYPLVMFVFYWQFHCLHAVKLLCRSPSAAAQLERDTKGLLTSLEEKVERRLYELRMPLTSNVLKKIRLSSSDLKVKDVW